MKFFFEIIPKFLKIPNFEIFLVSNYNAKIQIKTFLWILSRFRLRFISIYFILVIDSMMKQRIQTMMSWEGGYWANEVLGTLILRGKETNSKRF